MNEHQVVTQKHQENKANLASQTSRLTPVVDIYETGEELVVMADLPGVTESGLGLEVSRGVLTLEAEIQAAENEKISGYYRQFRLSERIDADAGSAALKDGVLTLRLPKKQVEKPKKIAVKTLH
ncbi:MAG: Hsp20/alpha crystallin family protein [Thermodesulfobacteriota bacterium]|nr:Hsp20/alpha crystallin family protein [Thermodesulfobacteriota bacterium]